MHLYVVYNWNRNDRAIKITRDIAISTGIELELILRSECVRFGIKATLEAVKTFRIYTRVHKNKHS